MITLANPLTRWLCAALVAVAAISGAYTLGRIHGAQGAKSESLERTLENAEEFNEGAANPDGSGWFDRLFPGGAE